MAIYVNSGNEGFKSALNSQIYIDKTDMLEYTNAVLIQNPDIFVSAGLEDLGNL